VARAKTLDPQAQLDRDMLELMGYPAFRRFLFTIAERSGIAASAYGSNIDTSKADGRRSLGIEILEMAERGLPVRDETRSPFNALGVAITEISRLQPQATGADDEDDIPSYED
jgi:hypothetical protein